MLLGKVPGPSTSLSSTGLSFLAKAPSRDLIVLTVSPGSSTVSGPKVGVGEKTSFSSSKPFSDSGLISKCTVSATPSGRVVGSIARGNF